MNPFIRFGWDCDGLLDAIRSESIPRPWSGHWMESAPLIARLVARQARVLGLIDGPPQGDLVAVLASRRKVR